MEEQQKLKEKKLSYEELNNVCHQLSNQSRELYQKLQEANQFNMFKRLDYLFAVVKFYERFSTEFATKCIEEIEQIMTIPDAPNEQEETKESE